MKGIFEANGVKQTLMMMHDVQSDKSCSSLLMFVSLGSEMVD